MLVIGLSLAFVATLKITGEFRHDELSSVRGGVPQLPQHLARLFPLQNFDALTVPEDEEVVFTCSVGKGFLVQLTSLIDIHSLSLRPLSAGLLDSQPGTVQIA